MTIFSLIIGLISLNYFSFPGTDNNSSDSFADDTLKIVEKVYLHTDRDSYHPGDDIWFKAYLLDASNRILSENSRNLHIDLISPASKIIDSRLVLLNGGLGNGDFRLPETLPSGFYKLRAYTNYMRNYNDQQFFIKDILIINYSDTSELHQKAANSIEKKFELYFFPEGGSLVDNVSSVVAFKAVDEFGKGCEVSGEIYSSSGGYITSFSSSHKGMGTLILRPVTGLSYYGIARNTRGDIVQSDLPKSFSTGIVMSCTINDKNSYLITIKTNTVTLPIFLNQDLVLTVSLRNEVFKTVSFKIKTLFNSFVLPVDDLPEGIVMLTLSDSKKLSLCDRLVFINKNYDVRLEVMTDKREYKQRDSVLVKIKLSGTQETTPEMFSSMSASGKIYTGTFSRFPTNISSWFLLESDVRGFIEEPSYYFDPNNPDRLKNLDLLLLTQGWRDFEWKYKDVRYLAERGFIISGKVSRLTSDLPLENASVNIGIFQDNNKIISSLPTDSSGRFRLEFDNITGSASIIVSAIGKKGNLKGRLTLDSVNYSPAEFSGVTGGRNMHIKNNKQVADNLLKLDQEYEIKKSLKKKYTLSDTILLDEVKIVSEKKYDPQTFQIENSRMQYGFPDKEIIITSEMKSYVSIRDLLTGKVPGLSFTAPVSGNDSGIRINGPGSLFSDQQPAFMLDGMVVPYSQISSIPVSWIDRIDILKGVRAAFIGLRGNAVVISVITKTIDNIPSEMVQNSANITISGYDAPRIFYSPRHFTSLESDYKPDLRTTLFWEPDIKLKNGEDLILRYFNGDNPSTIRITIEGVTSDGIPLTGHTEYEVK